LNRVENKIDTRDWYIAKLSKPGSFWGYMSSAIDVCIVHAKRHAKSGAARTQCELTCVLLKMMRKNPVCLLRQFPHLNKLNLSGQS
jgi:hypothetical protein